VNKLRFNHQQIQSLLDKQKNFLLALSENFGSKSPTQLRSDIQAQIVEIDRAFTKGRTVNNKRCTDGCHFVKNGTYKRGATRVQNEICTVCGKLKPTGRLRPGFDSYLVRRLVQLKLEGIPMETIAKLLSVNRTNLEYQWRVVSQKTFRELLAMEFKSDFRMTSYKTRKWSDFDGQYQSLKSYEQDYKIEFPIDYERVLMVNRRPTINEATEYRKVRLAQVLLLMRFGNHLQGFEPDYKLVVNGIYGTKIKEFVKLPRVGERDIAVSEISKSDNQSGNLVPFNIRFDFDQVVDLQMPGTTPTSHRKSIKF
jgi:hypothetical protein